MPTVNHYEELGVSESATTAEIRRAYLDAARRNHPDLVGPGQSAARAAAERRMAKINLAWSVLGDTAKRQQYDQELRRARGDFQRAAPREAAAWVPGRPSPDFVPFEPDDEQDTFDPGGLDDTPMRDLRPVPRWMQLLPPGLLAVSLASFAVYFVTSVRLLLGLAGVTFGLGTVSFLVAPMYAIAHSSRSGR
jgi:hypothetical protein